VVIVIANSRSKDEATSPITIVVGYAWAKDGDTLIEPQNDARWKFLKGKIEPEANALRTIVSKRPGRRRLDISIRRLRGRHGDMILNAVRTRIEEADVLLLDIGDLEGKGFNSNVLIEVGVAFGLDHHLQQNLFILKPKDQPLPSDLAGFLVTDYVSSEKQFKLSDDRGFRAALRSSLLRLAEKRGMIGPPSSDSVASEDDEAPHDRSRGPEPIE